MAAQRTKQGKGKLPPHRETRLNSIDFRWATHRAQRNDPQHDLKWMDKYAELLEFKKEMGHTMVTCFWKRNKPLGQWVGKQRTQYAQNDLPQDRIDLLNEIEFVWRIDSTDAGNSLSQREWDNMFCHLETFKQTYGHVEVHRSYRLNGLGSWLCVQRADARKGRMHLRRIERLRWIGVEWGKDFDARWQEGYDNLMQYKKQFGHCDLDLNIITTTHQKLANWVKNQRHFQQNGTLLPEREAMLNSVGFTWIGQIGSVRSKMEASEVTKRKRSTRASSSANGGDNDDDDDKKDQEDKESGMNQNDKEKSKSARTRTRSQQRKRPSSSSLKSRRNDGNDGKNATYDSPSLKRNRDIHERVTNKKTKKSESDGIHGDSDDESLSSSSEDGTDDESYCGKVSVKSLNPKRSDSNYVPENDSVSAQSSDPPDKKVAHSFFDEWTPDSNKSCEVVTCWI